MEVRRLVSELDKSVNFVWDLEPGQAIEARYVRRGRDYFACYLSSQTACEKACRMCHLTQTGQNKAEDVNPDMLLEQRDYLLRRQPRPNRPAIERALPGARALRRR